MRYSLCLYLPAGCKRYRKCAAEEVDLAHDMMQWEKMNDDERHFIKMILGFFAQSDGIVLENLGSRFMREIQIPEVWFQTLYFFDAVCLCRFSWFPAEVSTSSGHLSLPVRQHRFVWPIKLFFQIPHGCVTV